MTDRADEIARDMTRGLCVFCAGEDGDAAKALAAALRAYGDERRNAALKEAAQALYDSPVGASYAAYNAGMIRALSAQEPRKGEP